MPQKEPDYICAFCERRFDSSSALTEHHLLPRAEGGKKEHTAMFCRLCHSTVHASFSNHTLAGQYDSISALREAPELKPYLKWVKKQDPNSRFKTRPRKDRK